MREYLRILNTTITHPAAALTIENLKACPIRAPPPCLDDFRHARQDVRNHFR